MTTTLIISRLDNPLNYTYWEEQNGYCFSRSGSKFQNDLELIRLVQRVHRKFVNDLEGTSKQLDGLIEIYEHCVFALFRNFADLLRRYHDTIIHSFLCVLDEHLEGKQNHFTTSFVSFNNKPSALRTQSHGVKNIRYTRNLILWHMRKDVAIRFVPYKHVQVHTYDCKRGSYKNKKTG